ncbi:hypothetical protein N8H72_27890 [Pseudomonas koreensis]|uniref:hypothetical protein n=1 Tax=Pseudomonas koreensis TaxID=198620 RepID=UPI0021C6FFEF|nr:hypothetical protein [Pseudomonas koreensis]MCU0093823.1 hypothetical protein [Pseudomonas koreensis]
MKFIELAMPVILIGLAFLLKLLIDRTVTIPDTISSILDLPADIAFFSLSVIFSFTIAKPENRDDGLVYFVGFIVISLLVIFLWRRSLSTFSAGRKLIPAFADLVNYTITLFMATHAINLMRAV